MEICVDLSDDADINAIIYVDESDEDESKEEPILNFSTEQKAELNKRLNEFYNALFKSDYRYDYEGKPIGRVEIDKSIQGYVQHCSALLTELSDFKAIQNKFFVEKSY